MEILPFIIDQTITPSQKSISSNNSAGCNSLEPYQIFTLMLMLRGTNFHAMAKMLHDKKLADNLIVSDNPSKTLEDIRPQYKDPLPKLHVFNIQEAWQNILEQDAQAFQRLLVDQILQPDRNGQVVNFGEAVCSPLKEMPALTGLIDILRDPIKKSHLGAFLCSNGIENKGNLENTVHRIVFLGINPFEGRENLLSKLTSIYKDKTSIVELLVSSESEIVFDSNIFSPNEQETLNIIGHLVKARKEIKHFFGGNITRELAQVFQDEDWLDKMLKKNRLILDLVEPNTDPAIFATILLGRKKFNLLKNRVVRELVKKDPLQFRSSNEAEILETTRNAERIAGTIVLNVVDGLAKIYGKYSFRVDNIRVDLPEVATSEAQEAIYKLQLYKLEKNTNILKDKRFFELIREALDGGCLLTIDEYKTVSNEIPCKKEVLKSNTLMYACFLFLLADAHQIIPEGKSDSYVFQRLLKSGLLNNIRFRAIYVGLENSVSNSIVKHILFEGSSWNPSVPRDNIMKFIKSITIVARKKIFTSLINDLDYEFKSS